MVPQKKKNGEKCGTSECSLRPLGRLWDHSHDGSEHGDGRQAQMRVFTDNSKLVPRADIQRKGKEDTVTSHSLALGRGWPAILRKNELGERRRRGREVIERKRRGKKRGFSSSDFLLLLRRTEGVRCLVWCCTPF